MRKEDVRRIYDGSIFRHKADVYAEKQRQKARAREKQAEKEKAKEATKQRAEKDGEHSRQDSGGWGGIGSPAVGEECEKWVEVREIREDSRGT